MIRLLISLIFTVLAAAPSPGAPLEVDVELVLAVDVSRSMAPAELEIQRRGYAEALSSDEVVKAIGQGMLGRVAITYVEWAGEVTQSVVIPWTLVETKADAQALADQLSKEIPRSRRRTSISGAIDFARGLIDDNDFAGMRQVIDVSGDGPNNDGRPVLDARARALAQGIVINGLPLMTDDGFGSWQVERLDLYYQDCVIGGPGSFMMPVSDWSQFADAVRRKLVLEIAGLPVARPQGPIKVQSEVLMDCLIGEKMRQRREQMYDMP